MMITACACKKPIKSTPPEGWQAYYCKRCGGLIYMQNKTSNSKVKADNTIKPMQVMTIAEKKIGFLEKFNIPKIELELGASYCFDDVGELWNFIETAIKEAQREGHEKGFEGGLKSAAFFRCHFQSLEDKEEK